MEAAGSPPEVLSRYRAALLRQPGLETGAVAKGKSNAEPPLAAQVTAACPFQILPISPGCSVALLVGAVRIDSVRFEDADGVPLALANGGDGGKSRDRRRRAARWRRHCRGSSCVTLLDRTSSATIRSEIYRLSPRAFRSGRRFRSSASKFRFPYLPSGRYSIAPSIISGTQADHSPSLDRGSHFVRCRGSRSCSARSASPIRAP